LIKASKAGDAERVSRLLANGHDPTARDAKGRSPYQLAANKEVRRLLQDVFTAVACCGTCYSVQLCSCSV
jgi:hypothetical protein